MRRTRLILEDIPHPDGSEAAVGRGTGW